MPITHQQYQQAKEIIKLYEEEQGIRPVYECICRLNGFKSWQTDECPFSQELHNDNHVCTRKLGDKIPKIESTEAMCDYESLH